MTGLPHWINMFRGFPRRVLYGLVVWLGEVAGRNAKSIRSHAGVRLEDFAKALRRYGIKWSTGAVGDFEAGRTAPDLRTLYVVAAALNDVAKRTVTLADLFAGTGSVQINKELSVSRAAIRASLTGKAPAATKVPGMIATVDTTHLPAWGRDIDPALIGRILADFVETDEKACKQIPVDTGVGAAAMAKLWGRTFRAERDHRAGPHANVQRRGRVSVQLRAELETLLNPAAT